MSIPVDQLRGIDLSLLVYFVVLVEEKTIPHAATRLGLSRTALTRALQQLRQILHDDLVVRTENGYQATPRGEELLTRLTTLLPQIDDILAGKEFQPETSNTTFKITAADSLCYFYAPILARKHRDSPGVSFIFTTYDEDRYVDLETNARDLVLDAEYKALGGGFRTELLFEEELICAVAINSPHGATLSLEDYLGSKHICISTLDGIQAIPDLAFARRGLRRCSPLRVPYFAVGLAMVADSELIVTLPTALARTLVDPGTTRLVTPPKELETYRYVMTWHRRQENDPRHIWLRQTLRSATREFLELASQKNHSSSFSPKKHSDEL